MGTCPSPIATGNFQDAWRAVTRKRRRSMKKALIHRVCFPVAQVIYFCLFLILAVGIFYKMGDAAVRSYMDRIPQIAIWWDRLSSPVLSAAAGEAGRILRCAGVLYLVPFCAVLLPAVLILLVYHPRTAKQTGEAKADAWQLQNYAKQARIYARKRDRDAAVTCAVFMGVFMAVFVLGLMMIIHGDPSVREEMQGQTFQSSLRCVLYGAAMFVCYRIINIPLNLLLKVLCACHVPESMVTDSEYYYNCVCDQETPAADSK